VYDTDFINTACKALLGQFIAINYPKIPNVFCSMNDCIKVSWATLYLETVNPSLDLFNWIVHPIVEEGFQENKMKTQKAPADYTDS
jgi:hypothetical protein